MPIPYFDAHCDTPVPVHFVPGKLRRNGFHLDLERLSVYSPSAQVFSVCVRRGARMVEETENVVFLNVPNRTFRD